MIQALIPILGTIGAQVAKNLFPDPADEAKREGSKYRHQRKRPMIHSGRGISKGPWTPPEQTNAALGKDK